MNKYIVFIGFSFCLSFTCGVKNLDSDTQSVSCAFYNLDNLFDTIDDSSHNDDDFTPNGKYKWTNERYKIKLKNMNKVITDMVDGSAPDILGVCELESQLAFADLLQTKGLKNNFKIVHFDSEDERGIDVALAYNHKKFTVLEAQNFKVVMSQDTSDRTRDILYVKLKSQINNDTLVAIVCHFPSRREGKAESEQNRIDAGLVVKSILNSKCHAMSRVIVMGDFNDQPWDKSMTQGIGALSRSKCASCMLQNLMFELKDGEGSYRFRGHWERLDQIILSKALLDGKGTDYQEQSLRIKKEAWMLQKGKYEGYPLRTFGGDDWLNGYSDHLPVYVKLNMN
jgi:predicted extracellular nuclease